MFHPPLLPVTGLYQHEQAGLNWNPSETLSMGTLPVVAKLESSCMYAFSKPLLDIYPVRNASRWQMQATRRKSEERGGRRQMAGTSGFNHA